MIKYLTNFTCHFKLYKKLQERSDKMLELEENKKLLEELKQKLQNLGESL